MVGELLEFERFIMVNFRRIINCFHSQALRVVVAALFNSEKNF